MTVAIGVSNHRSQTSTNSPKLLTTEGYNIN